LSRLLAMGTLRFLNSDSDDCAGFYFSRDDDDGFALLLPALALAVVLLF